jgi:isoquinoline 1-oxidoreductase beta subunit
MKTTYNRRSFFKVSAVAGGGILVGFNWLASHQVAEASTRKALADLAQINGYIQIDASGVVTIMSANPEVGQNVKTSMPMIIAEELDVAWDKVIVKQAPLDTKAFVRQVAGGSQSLRFSWKTLRLAGATARQMLISAAAKKWNVSPNECTVSEGVISNAQGARITYGEIASEAAKIEVPKEVVLKNPKDFKIIGKNTTNVDISAITTGKPLFGLDYTREGMLYAVALRPPAFGQKLDSFDDKETRKINGVKDVIRFGDKIAVLAENTWAAIKGQKALKAQWKEGTKLESTEDHDKQMRTLLGTTAKEPKRNDGDVKTAFATADKIVERIFEAPFLPHSSMEPMNFFAYVTENKAEMVGPTQRPEETRKRVAELLGMKEDQITIDITRIGGGFGRRLMWDFALEVAEISKLAKKPIKLVFTREDDMTAGLYRPASKYKFRMAIKDKKAVGYHLVGTGANGQNFTRESFFPAGAFDNLLIESHNLESNITTAPWRAPITNFLAFAEQAFFDEVAQELGIDAVKFRIDLFEQAKINATKGVKFEYDPEKSIGVIKLAAEKANWGSPKSGVYQGFSAYYSHNTYVAQVAEVEMKNNQPVVTKVICAIDCGIVVNPIAAINQSEGGIIDGIGHALFGDFSFKDGKPQASNFNTYRLIRMPEAPKVEIHFVPSLNDPTGLGEPTLPPVGAAVANAIFAATGKRLYRFPFVKDMPIRGGS